MAIRSLKSLPGQAGVKPTWGAGNGVALPGNYMINAGAAIQVAADIFFKHNSVLTTGTLSEKAALQLAVWEALYDTTFGSSILNLGAGRFTVNSGDAAAIAQANTWLGEVHTDNYSGFLLIPDSEQQWGFPCAGSILQCHPGSRADDLDSRGVAPASVWGEHRAVSAQEFCG